MDPRIGLQLERLYRSYMGARQNVDYISALDMAHHLRVWIEISRSQEFKNSKDNFRRFKSAKPTKKSKKILNENDAEYLWLCMANYNHGEVIQLELATPDLNVLPFTSKSIKVSGQVAHPKPRRPAGIKGFYVGNSLEGFKSSKVDIRTNLDLEQFLGSDILFYRRNGVCHRYPSGYIIGRAANAFSDASHFQSAAEPVRAEKMENVFPLITVSKIGSLSFLYFFLLYVAQEILVGFGKMERFEIEKKRSSAVN